MPTETTTDIPAATDEQATPTDLAELIASFNDVTGKLERTHVQLRGEVARLHEELREANEALQRSKRLAALGEMAAGIAHEIRNPLGSIGLYARMLREDLDGEPERRATADKIAGAVRRLDEIVGDVLAFARELTIRQGEAGAADIFDAALEAAAIHHRIRIRRGDRVRPLDLNCDAGLLQQAIVNLLRNAAEAMDDDEAPLAPRSITTTAAIRTDQDSQRPVAVLAVRDSGPGVPPDVVARMFNPFFTTRATGTGLGLAIVNRIADAHGGWVEVINNADRDGGRGATVELHIPQPVSQSQPHPQNGHTQPGVSCAPTEQAA